MTIPPQGPDRNPSDALFDAAPITSPPIDRHWFVGAVYCLACGLPRANGRHVPKAA